MQRLEEGEVWRANLAKRKRRWPWKRHKTRSPVEGVCGHSYRQKAVECIISVLCKQLLLIVLIQRHTYCASKHCAITGLSVKVNVYFSWVHTVYFFLPVCLETSVHWQLCVNGWVPAGMGRHKGRAPKDHCGPQLSWVDI